MVGVHRPRLAATGRELGKKSALTAMRRDGVIPGSLCGKGVSARSIHIPARALGGYLDAHGSGALLDLELAGELIPVVLREVDRNAISSAVVHVTFQRIAVNEMFHASIPVRFEGVDDLIRRGLVLQTQMDAIEVHGQAGLLPEVLTVDVRSYGAGDVIQTGSVSLPEGIQLTKSGAAAIAIVTAPRTTELESGESASVLGDEATSAAVASRPE
jgi:large subunit ribosomal protein L25